MSNRSLVNQATTKDTRPPSGYILKQLAQKTFVSDKDSEDIGQHLLNKISENDPDIRYKALQCIKYLCLNGKDSFKLKLQRKNDKIRDCTHYRGPPDPLRGDAPSERVRKTAKETMSALFADTSSHQAKVSGRISGHGANVSQSQASQPEPQSSSSRSDYRGTYNRPGDYDPSSAPKLESGAYSTGRMQGFGNPAYNNQKKSGFLDKIKKTVNEALDGPQRKRTPPPPQWQRYPEPQRYDPQANTQRANNDPPRKSSTENARTSSGNRRGQVRGTWGNNSGNSGNSGIRSRQNNNNGSSSNSGSGANIGRQTTASNGEYEGRLVKEITAPSGVRSVPKPKELKEFIAKAKNLDQPLLATLLQDQFESDAWQTQLKTLCVVEALCKNGFNTIIEYFQEEFEALVGFEESSIRQVSSKASSILVLIGIKDPPTREAVQQQQQPRHSSPTKQPVASPNLLDLDSISDPVESNPVPVEVEADAEPSGFDFMGSGDADEAPVQETTDIFSNITVKDPTADPAPEPTPAPKPIEDPFDALIGSTSSPAGPTGTSGPTNKSQAAPVNTDDIFGFMNQGPQPDPLASLMPTANMSPQQNAQQAPMYHQQQQPQRMGQAQPFYNQPNQQPQFNQTQGFQQQQQGFPPMQSGFGQPMQRPNQQFNAQPMQQHPNGQQLNQNQFQFTVQAANPNASSEQRINAFNNVGQPQQEKAAFGFVSNESDPLDFVRDHMASH